AARRAAQRAQRAPPIARRPGAAGLRRDGVRQDRLGPGVRGAAEGGRRQGRARPQRDQQGAPRRRVVTSTQPIAATTGAFAPPAQPEIGERGSDGYIRKVGRELLLAVYGALRTVKMYPPDNPVVQKTLEELVRLANDVWK